MVASVYLQSKDEKRYYSITNIQLDLFDKYTVCIKYGKKDCPGHTIYRYFEDKKSMEKYYNRMLDLRFKHGYFVVDSKTLFPG